jgi:hypothetical protein
MMFDYDETDDARCRGVQSEMCPGRFVQKAGQKLQAWSGKDAGFIGSHTLDELVRRRHSVAVLDDLSSGKERNPAGTRDRIDVFVFRGSITVPTR